MTDAAIRLPDTPAPFKAWLESLPADQVVGAPHHSKKDPLVAYLLAQGATSAYVAKFAYNVNGARFPTPLWVQSWVDLLDEQSTCYDPKDVTAAECLRLLEGLPHA